MTEVAARIIEKSRRMSLSVRDEAVKKQLQDIIRGVSNITHGFSVIAKQRQNKLEQVDITSIEREFNELRKIMLSLPEQMQPENGFASTSYKIAGVCFYLLVVSMAITMGATFGAWYLGFLTATYFVNMLMISLAYFEIPVLLVGLISYAVKTFQPEPSSDLNSLDEDVNLLFDKSRSMIEHIKGTGDDCNIVSVCP